MSIRAAFVSRSHRKLSSPPYRPVLSAPASEVSSASSTKPPNSSMLPRFAYERGTSMGSSTIKAIATGLPQEIDPGRDAAEVRPVDTEDVQCPAFDDLRPDRPCALDGALGEGDRLGASAGQHQVAGQAREDACLVGRRRRPVEQVDGLLEQTERGSRIAGQLRRVPDTVPGRAPVVRGRRPSRHR